MTPFEIGKSYFVRTLTDYWVGRLVSVDGPYVLTLTDFAWVAGTGRFAVFLRDGEADGMEVEPAPDGMTNTVQWLSVISWPHPLLRKQV